MGVAVCSWWEAFYRTGSIIFGGGQARPCPSMLARQQSACAAVLHNMPACDVAHQGFGVTARSRRELVALTAP